MVRYKDAADTIEAQAALIAEAREAMRVARECVYSITHLLLPDEPGFEKAVDGLEELDAFLSKLDGAFPDPVPHDRRSPMEHERG